MAKKVNLAYMREHIMAQMELLNDPTLDDEQFRTAIESAKVMAQLGKVLVESAKVEVLAIKYLDGEIMPSDFLTSKTLQLGNGKI
jgi:hypothetical protein